MTSTLRRISLTLSFVLCLTLAASSASAQDAEGVGVGLKGGLLFSNLDFGANDDFLANRTGLIGGLFVGGNRGGLLGVEADVFYARKGSTVGAAELDIHMLEIPVLLRLNAGSRSLRGVAVYGLVGPAMDFRLKSELDGIDIVDATEGYDVNLVIGGGIEITRFLAEVRYNHGLRNISKNFAASDQIKTRSWALLVGVRFN